MRSRAAEMGFSIVEALVMLAVTALVLGLLLPVVSRGAALDSRAADAGDSYAAQARGEAGFRAIVRRADIAPGAAPSSAPATGDAYSISLYTFVEAPTVCTLKAGWARVTLWIENSAQGGKLQCATQGRTDTLARWADGSATFSYGQTGSAWRERLVDAGDIRSVGQPTARAATLDGSPLIVRFSVRGGVRETLVWMESTPAPAVAAPEGVARDQDGGGDLDR